ncbi:MAG: CDP-archaeol synthase, partial [Acidobacteria bacterium]|nr:CDP-archaeol synthase [Acidobacteriota bacterium]
MTRVLTALVLIPVVVTLVWWAPGWLLFLAVLPFAGLSLWEYFELAGRMGLVPNRWLSYLLALALCALSWLDSSRLLAGSVAAALLLVASEI